MPGFLLIKLQAPACKFVKKILLHRCFPVNIAIFLRTPLGDCFGIVTLRSFNRHVVAFFEANVLKEVHVLCVISTIRVRCLYQSSKVKLITVKFGIQAPSPLNISPPINKPIKIVTQKWFRI